MPAARARMAILPSACCLFRQHEEFFTDDLAIFDGINRDLAQSHLPSSGFLRHLGLEPDSETVGWMYIRPIRVKAYDVIVCHPIFTFSLNRGPALCDPHIAPRRHNRLYRLCVFGIDLVDMRYATTIPHRLNKFMSQLYKLFHERLPF